MPTYQLEFSEDPAVFIERAGELLAADPVVTTVVATTTARAADDADAGRPRPAHPQWWVSVVDDDGRVVGAAMRTAPFAPYPLYVLPMPDAAAAALGRALVERGEGRAGANGALPAARLVAEAAAAALGARVSVGRQSRLWRLGQLSEPPAPPGAGRLATVDDLDLAVQWFADFHVAADAQAGRAPGSHPAMEFDRADVLRRIDEQRVWLWLDEAGTPVSLTGFNAPAFGVARVGPVYTPDEQRGRGFASALVALVSRGLRDEGAAVCLFTDQANPTSNKIYAAVGYEAVVDTADHGIEPDGLAAPDDEVTRPGPA